MIRIAGVVLAALALTGCGQVSSTHSSPHSLSPVKNLVLTAAATHTRHAGSARVAMDMTASTEQGTITMHGTGQFRLQSPAAGAMHLSMTVPRAQVRREARLCPGSIRGILVLSSPFRYLVSARA